MINYDELDAEYDSLPTREKVARSTKPEGSLTDNLRFIKPRRDGAFKRLRAFKEANRVEG